MLCFGKNMKLVHKQVQIYLCYSLLATKKYQKYKMMGGFVT